ncbi:hypothetical protein, partial [Pediococcus acidilactici]
MNWKATFAFPSPTAASVVVKLTSAWQCGATTVLKSSSAVFADLLFGFDFLLIGSGKKHGGTTTPPMCSLLTAQIVKVCYKLMYQWFITLFFVFF